MIALIEAAAAVAAIDAVAIRERPTGSEVPCKTGERESDFQTSADSKHFPK
ncbi:hypothetical protein RRSWK_02982 [Rhodopirellula sp. SWK7]|nr:hypothetical protein RRSWK_02982 [Rhodopirellula sp. SWK7]